MCGTADDAAHRRRPDRTLARIRVGQNRISNALRENRFFAPACLMFSYPFRPPQRPPWRCAAALAALLWLSGCADLGYYWQSIGGHLKLLNAARPVPDWLADPAASQALKDRLELAQRIRAYAVSELHLPDNASYHRYARIERRAVVWNVVAAPPDSLVLKTWCFPIAGCVSYRGYYDQADARSLAADLKAHGEEVAVQGVPAYSTLGWSNWLGGDPLVSTFIYYPEGELARLIFHELAHQELYAKNDTMFNESFATAVERLGAERWLAERASPAAQAEYETFDARRRAFRDLVLASRRVLERIYKEKRENALVQRSWTAMKKEAMDDFRANYAKLRAKWLAEPGAEARQFVGYDAWVADANNARFGAMAAYDQLVPGFEALFEREGRSFERFYAAARRLSELPKAERDQQLMTTTKAAGS